MQGEGEPTAGLGTNIVTALARHLAAEVTTADNQPGVTVVICHDESVNPTEQARDDEEAV